MNKISPGETDESVCPRTNYKVGRERVDHEKNNQPPLVNGAIKLIKCREGGGGFEPHNFEQETNRKRSKTSKRQLKTFSTAQNSSNAAYIQQGSS